MKKWALIILLSSAQICCVTFANAAEENQPAAQKVESGCVDLKQLCSKVESELKSAKILCDMSAYQDAEKALAHVVQLCASYPYNMAATATLQNLRSDALYELGRVSYQLAKYDKARQTLHYAIQAVDDALAANPCDFDALATRQKCFVQLGSLEKDLHNYEAAQFDLESSDLSCDRMQKLRPGVQETIQYRLAYRIALGELLVKLKREELAKYQFEKAVSEAAYSLRKSPDNILIEKFKTRAHVGLSVVYQRKLDYVSARAEADKAVDLMQASASKHPERADCLVDLAFALGAKAALSTLIAEREKAIVVFNQALVPCAEAIKLAPHFFAARSRLGTINLLIGTQQLALNKFAKASRSIDAAIENFTQLRSSAPELSTLNSDLALCYLQNGTSLCKQNQPAKSEKSFEQGLAYSEKSLTRFPTFADAWTTKAMLLAGLAEVERAQSNTTLSIKKDKESILAMNKALELDPSDSSVLLLRADTFFRIGQWQHDNDQGAEAKESVTAAINDYDSLSKITRTFVKGLVSAAEARSLLNLWERSEALPKSFPAASTPAASAEPTPSH